MDFRELDDFFEMGCLCGKTLEPWHFGILMFCFVVADEYVKKAIFVNEKRYKNGIGFWIPFLFFSEKICTKKEGKKKFLSLFSVGYSIDWIVLFTLFSCLNSVKKESKEDDDNLYVIKLYTVKLFKNIYIWESRLEDEIFSPIKYLWQFWVRTLIINGPFFSFLFLMFCYSTSDCNNWQVLPIHLSISLFY